MSMSSRWPYPRLLLWTFHSKPPSIAGEFNENPDEPAAGHHRMKCFCITSLGPGAQALDELSQRHPYFRPVRHVVVAQHGGVRHEGH